VSEREAAERWVLNKRAGVLPARWSVRSIGYACWVAGGLLLFAFGYYVTIARGINTADESWFLQVVHRVTSGEILYREVFFGVTPLSIYLTATLTTLFGTENLVVKGIVSLCFATTVLITRRIVWQLGSTQSVNLLMVLALLVYTRPLPNAVYTPLAYLFFLGCFSVILLWRERVCTQDSNGSEPRQPYGLLAIAGILAGLCFATKQNLGLYALAAVLVVVFLIYRRKQCAVKGLLTPLFLVLVVFIFSSLVVLLPVWFSGGTWQLLDYGFTNRVNFVRMVQVSYFDGQHPLDILPRAVESFGGFMQFYWQVRFLLPPLTLAVLLFVWLRSRAEEREMLFTAILFISAGLLGAFPIADSYHLTYAIPLLLVGLSHAWSRIKASIAPSYVRTIHAVVFAWFGAGLCFILVNPFVKIASGDYQTSTLPHFRGAFIQGSQEAAVNEHVKAFKEEAGGDSEILILSQEAGFYYLVAGLKNPTPFDYPWLTTFGRHGLEEVLTSLSAKRIRTVCLEYQWSSSPWAPEPLVRFVREEMVRGKDLGFCIIYRARIGESVVERKG
jgi:hypothetical protein